MKLSEEQVRYVAALANLQLTEEEIHRFTGELGSILAYMEKLNELDTSAVEPMAQVLHAADESATLREDVEAPVLGQLAAVANAPLAGAGFFKVPRVIEK